jgi:transglutaminase-like putative cysteine protease
MRLAIRHETIYTYERPATRAIQTLRLTPRGYDGLFVVNWRIDIDCDCRLDQSSDPFGNLVHNFTVEGPLDRLAIVAHGQVETVDTNGVVTGQIERFPPAVFLRDTALTTADAAIRRFAEATAADAGPNPNRIALMHAVMDGIRKRMRFDLDVTDTGTSATQAFAFGHGVCQDFAHVFIAAVRHLGIPARYVSGYMLHVDGLNEYSAGHAWAEVLVDDLGWVGFDPANGICPTDAYVRVAVGLDYLEAAPVRGAHYGGGGETLAVKVTIEHAGPPRRAPPIASQWQQQTGQ